MATLFTYSKKGEQITSASNATLEQGGLDWLGGHHFMHNNATAIHEFVLNANRIAPVETLRWRAGTDGYGIACSHQFEDDPVDDSHFNNGGTFIATSSPGGAGIPFDISLFHWSRGKTGNMNNYATISGNLSIGGACSDGVYYYIVRTSSSIPSNKAVRKYVMNGSSAFLVDNFFMTSLTTGVIKDICFDQRHNAFWLVDGTTIRKFDSTLSKELTNFAGPAGAWGITTDEHNLYIQGT